MSGTAEAYCLFMTATQNQTEHDTILKVLQFYIDGCNQGNND